MATATSINIQMPRGDMAFLRQLAKRMGWSLSEVTTNDRLYDPETGEYLNEETMQAIRDAEAGKVTRCNSFDEILSAL
jgi:hypothetical protein